MQIDSPCLDCGEPTRVEIRDGEVLNADPDTIVGHVSVPFLKWMEDPGFA